MPYMVIDPATGDVLEVMYPSDTGQWVARIMEVPPEPEPEPDSDYCPPAVQPVWCPPPEVEASCTTAIASLAADCECVVWDGGVTQWDGGVTAWLCEESEPSGGEG